MKINIQFLICLQVLTDTCSLRAQTFTARSCGTLVWWCQQQGATTPHNESISSSTNVHACLLISTHVLYNN